MNPQPQPPSDPTAAALVALDRFGGRLLFSTVRRIFGRRGLPFALLPQHLDELGQELRLDCVENGAEIAALTEPDRHARWMRLVERWVVADCRAHPGSTKSTVLPESLEAPGQATAERPEVEFPGWFRRCDSGRINLAATARECGTSEYRLRRRCRDALLDSVDAERQRYWGRRLAEALLGIAAERLRLAGLVPHDGRADPQRRLLRLRRLARRIPRSGDADCPQQIAGWFARGDRALRCDVRDLLDTATWLHPDDPDAWLWRCEAHLAAGEWATALTSLRRARRLRPRDDLALQVARLRLREARRGEAAAAALAQRAMRRNGGHRVRELWRGTSARS